MIASLHVRIKSLRSNEDPFNAVKKDTPECQGEQQSESNGKIGEFCELVLRDILKFIAITARENNAAQGSIFLQFIDLCRT